MNRYCVLALLVMALCYLLPWHVWLVTGHVLAVRLGWLGVGILFAGMALSTRALPWRGMRLLYGAAVLMCLPALVPHDGTSPWLMLCRLSLLAMGVLMVGMLASNARTLRTDRVAVVGLLTAGGVVAFWSLATFYFPTVYSQLWQMGVRSVRPVGLLYQPNVTGSFLALTVTLGLWRWLRDGQRHGLPRLGLLAACMAALHLTQSTVAYLGVVTGFALLWLAFGRGTGRAFLLAALALTLGWSVTLWQPGTGLLPGQDHTNGWLYRLDMWRSCLALAAEKPWLGWGGGTFAGIYPDGLALLGLQQREPTLLTHPHNELMLWLVEGGVVSAAGLVLMAVWGGRLLLRAFPGRLPADEALRHGDSWGWGVCLMPVVLHMQTEFPLYQSALHYLALVLCAGLSLAAQRAWAQDGGTLGRPMFAATRWRGLTVLARAVGVMVGITVMGLTLTAANVDVQIARMTLLAGKMPLSPLLRARDLNLWVDHPQALRAQSTWMLAEYNRTHDARLLPPALRWLRTSLREYPDPNGYVQLLAVLRATGDKAGENAVRRDMQQRIRYPLPRRPGEASPVTGPILASQEHDASGDVRTAQ